MSAKRWWFGAVVGWGSLDAVAAPTYNAAPARSLGMNLNTSWDPDINTMPLDRYPTIRSCLVLPRACASVVARLRIGYLRPRVTWRYAGAEGAGGTSR